MELLLNADLSDLFNKYGSDKDRNGYAQCYTTLFHEKRHQPLTMMEIGIGTLIPGVNSSMVGYSLEGYKPGGSLRAWRDYFTQGRIIGVDIQPDTQFDDEPRIETYLCNSGNPTECVELIKKISEKFGDLDQIVDKPEGSNQPIQFDIILDDGSHYYMDQLNTLHNLYPHVKPGGIYIIEDVTRNSPISTSPGLVGACCAHDPYFFVGVDNNICVIYKNYINSKREGF
jgi:hypothetical protein